MSGGHFEPFSWLYGLLSSAVFGSRSASADDDRRWERTPTAALEEELAALDAAAAAHEALIDPDGAVARPGFDGFSFIITTAKAARLADWLHAPAYDAALRYNGAA